MPRRVAVILNAVVIALVLGSGLAACSSGGTQTQCDVAGCTVTFPRTTGGETSVGVLGVQARLLGVQNGTADLEVAGQRISLPVGGQTEAGSFTVGLQQLTDTQVVVRIQLA